MNTNLTPFKGSFVKCRVLEKGITIDLRPGEFATATSANLATQRPARRRGFSQQFFNHPTTGKN
jgi:hypothetical protein